MPSSCIRTVVNPETGKTERYFDADDEVYQALKCDEDKELKITDNTVELRISEHVDGINALLNILCFQVGLSPGSLSFDKAGGVKTATEVVSEENKTAVTIRCQKNLLVEFIEEMCRAVLRLAMITGEVPHGDFEVTVAFKDSVVIDDNTLIQNNINLVTTGLKSKVSAIMEVMKCDEEAAKRELEKINAESAVLGVSDGEGFAPLGSDNADDTAGTDDIIDSAEEAAGKTLNGAQTQSLIAVMAQYQSGALSLGQAINVISVAIGVSKEEAKKILEGAE